MWDFAMPSLQWVEAGVPILKQAHYRWRRDNGSETGASYLGDEDSTSTTKIYRGDRVRLRLLLSNTGTGSARNNVMQLEYASSSCTVWHSIPTEESATTEWVMDLSQHLRNGVSTTNLPGLTDPNGKTFTSGNLETYINGANWYAVTLSRSQFTEYEYAIRSTLVADRGINYCFRLTNGGSSRYFDYNVTPTITLSETSRPQAGGGSLEPDGVGPVITGGTNNGGGEQEENGVGDVQVGGGSGGGGGGDSG